MGPAVLASDVVDRYVEDWARIQGCVAFHMPSGDELLVRRKVQCPTCGHVAVMVLADGTAVSYAKRHRECSDTIEIEKESADSAQ